jgi:type IX secretion system PorP/SprF family membrane protein
MFNLKVELMKKHMLRFFTFSHRCHKLIIFSVVISCLAILPFRLFSQDIDFSMYQNTPLFINPANTGNFIGDWRLSGNFRNQFVATADPFRTASVGFDSRIYLLKQKIGVGLYFINDESGIGGLAFNKLYASLAYQFKISENYFSAGFQGGYVFGSVNSWGTWDQNAGSFSAPNGETNFGESVKYADMNAGIAWKRSIRIFNPEMGISLSHMNKPNKSFFGGDEKEDISFTLDARCGIILSDAIFFSPSCLFISKQNNLTIVGTGIGYKMTGSRSSVKQIIAGCYLRNGITETLNSFVFTLGTTIRRIDIGIAYDMNTGQLSTAAGSMGAFEVSFIYRSISTVLNSYSIPCERY